MHLRMDVTAPADLAGNYETDVRGAVCAFGMRAENDFYANPSGVTDDDENYGITLQVLDLADPRRADVLVNIGDDNFNVDEQNGTAEVTVNDLGDTAQVTASVEAVPLIDPNADALEFTMDLECLQIERH